MPYIDKETRVAIDSGRGVYTPGELNYQLTQLCLKYLKGNISYTSFNEVVGALECCKQELYRRMIGPYEDKKAEMNGDVFL